MIPWEVPDAGNEGGRDVGGGEMVPRGGTKGGRREVGSEARGFGGSKYGSHLQQYFRVCLVFYFLGPFGMEKIIVDLSSCLSIFQRLSVITKLCKAGPCRTTS
jgi:hypothetical protein